MTRVLVLGAYGLLGTSLCNYLVDKGYSVHKVSRSDTSEYQCDFLFPVDAANTFNIIRPDFIINLIAEVDVDKCEKHPLQAFVKNINPLVAVSEYIHKVDDTCRLIHISTDQVYSDFGYSSEQDIKPVNIYALTKLAAENIASSANGLILRTNFVGKSKTSNRKSLSDWIIEEAKAEKIFSLFSDIEFCPLDISTLISEIEKNIRNHSPGIFNISSVDGMSKAEFGLALLEELRFPTRNVRIVKSINHGFIAPRPLDMKMSPFLAIETLGLPVIKTYDEIKRIAEGYKID